MVELVSALMPLLAARGSSLHEVGQAAIDSLGAHELEGSRAHGNAPDGKGVCRFFRGVPGVRCALCCVVLRGYAVVLLCFCFFFVPGHCITLHVPVSALCPVRRLSAWWDVGR